MEYSMRPDGVTNCRHCGADLTNDQRQNRQVFCGKDCYLGETGKQQVPMCVCRNCGTKFKPRGNDRTTYCSRDCAFIDRAKRCKECGKPMTGNTATYCSEQCKEKACVVLAICKLCGQRFRTAKREGYCSDACKKEVARQQALQYYREQSWKERGPFVCAECTTQFTPGYGDKRRTFCSDRCAGRYASRNEKATRRVRMRNGPQDRIAAPRVFERDGWRCRLCGMRTPKELRGSNDDRAPEVDHIVPLSLGGTHTWGNVQCLCRVCNQIKGDRSMEELRPLG